MAICPNCHDTNSKTGLACPHCPEYYYIPEESAADADHHSMIGKIAADKYVVLGLINEGGMGAVYRALQMPVEREVALKVLRTELKDSDQAGDRFIREARAVSRLNHPNIITLFDFGFDSNRHPYMVMEYAPGISLGKWLKKPDLTVERIVNVTHQVLSALTEAHKQGIVHRDLKPENMIVTESSSNQDSVKLLDFGIARLINEGATKSLTRDGEVFGTPHYMAPEQAQGKKNVGPPADVYAMGIILYEMLTGSCPFDAPTPLAVLFMHINDALPDIVPKEGINVPVSLQEVITIATAKDPEHRFQDAAEMLIGLGEVVNELSGSGLSIPGLSDRTGEMLLANRSALLTPMPQPTESVTMPPSRSTDFPPYEPESSKKGGIIVLGLVVLCVFALAGVGVLIMGGDETSAEESPITEVTPDKLDPPEDTVTKEPATEVAVKDEIPETKPETAPVEPEIEKIDPDVGKEIDEPAEKVVDKPVVKKSTKKKKKVVSKPKETKKVTTKAKTTTKTTKKSTINGPKKFNKKPTKFGIK